MVPLGLVLAILLFALLVIASFWLLTAVLCASREAHEFELVTLTDNLNCAADHEEGLLSHMVHILKVSAAPAWLPAGSFPPSTAVTKGVLPSPGHSPGRRDLCGGGRGFSCQQSVRGRKWRNLESL